MMNRSRLNVPLKIYDFKNKNKEILENYVCQTDIYPLIKYFFDKEDKTNVIPPYGTKKPIISELYLMINIRFQLGLKIILLLYL